MTIKQNGGIFGRNPTFNDVDIEGTLDVSNSTLILANDSISGDAIDGGTISNFASTGIDDNASSASWTVSSGGDFLPSNTGAQDLGSSANAIGNIIQATDARREVGTSTVNKMIEIYGRKNIDTSTVDILTFPSGSGFGSANYTGWLSGELTLSFWGYNTGFGPIWSKRKYHVGVDKFQTNDLGLNISEITDWAQDDGAVTITPTLAQKSGASATSTTLELSATISSGTISELQVQIHFTALTQGISAALTWIDAEIAS